MIERRLFLFGSAASIIVAKTVLAKSFVDTIIPMPTLLGAGPRYVGDMVFSSMTLPGEEIIRDAVSYTFMVDHRNILQMIMDRRATFRWVASPMSEVYIPKGSTLSLLVEPCGFLTTLNVISNVGTYDDPIMYSEGSKWQGNKVITSTVEPLNPFKTIKLDALS